MEMVDSTVVWASWEFALGHAEFNISVRHPRVKEAVGLGVWVREKSLGWKCKSGSHWHFDGA